jgi:hypothetical protein
MRTEFGRVRKVRGRSFRWSRKWCMQMTVKFVIMILVVAGGDRDDPGLRVSEVAGKELNMNSQGQLRIPFSECA